MRGMALAAAILSLATGGDALAQRWDDPKTWGIVPDDAVASEPQPQPAPSANATAGTAVPPGAQVASNPAPKPYDPNLRRRKPPPEPK